MPTAAERITKLEGKVQYLEVREQLLTDANAQVRKEAEESGRRAELELGRLRDEDTKLRDEMARFREATAADVAVLKAEIADLK